MDTNLQNAKLELIQWLTALDNRSVILKILDLKKSESNLGKIDEARKNSIEKGIADADAGKLKPNAAAKEIYGKWL